MTDDTRAMSATGLLATFNAAGALTWSDVHPAQQWGYLSERRTLASCSPRR